MHWSRRELMASGGLMTIGSLIGRGLLNSAAEINRAEPRDVEQWGIFENSYKGPTDGNPFVDV
jgi:hypothetical protein